MPHEELWTAVDSYVNDLLVPHDSALEAALQASTEAGAPGDQCVPPLKGSSCICWARIQRATTILEIGTLGGYSTIWLARALPKGGRLITLESEPKHAEVARANVARAGLAEIVDVRLGKALETLPQVGGRRASPPSISPSSTPTSPANPDYFAWALKLSRPGSVIVVDNVVRGGRVLEADSTDPGHRGGAPPERDAGPGGRG